MPRFLDRRTSTVTPARGASQRPRDVEKGAPVQASPLLQMCMSTTESLG